MELALFDLDNTLLAGDSDHAWGDYLCAHGVVDPTDYRARNDAFYARYQAGTLDIHEFLDFVLAPLARLQREQLDRLHDQFVVQHILPMMTPAGRELVAGHLAQGALTAIVTATNAFVTAPIARMYGVHHLIATIPAQDWAEGGGRFTGRSAGTPAFREGKIVRVQAWLESLALHWGSFERSWFYSDSLNDLPLLERVSNPVAVDPDPTLREHAQARGWPVISLR